MSVNSHGGIHEDESLDAALRPKTWQDYIGQEQVKENLKVIIGAAKKRNEPPEHILIYGISGLGKTSLAHVAAGEMSAALRMTSGPAIEKAGDLAAILTNLQEGSVLFIDEIHRLPKIIEEHLYPAMEDYKLHLVVGKGPMARTMTLDLPKFTIIGATTRMAALTSPLRNRFGATFQLNFYTLGDIKTILQRSAGILNVNLEPKALEMIAQRSRFTPRVANRLLKRVRDFAQVEGKKSIDVQAVIKAFGFLGIDEKGLEQSDRKVLESLINRFNGGPAGLQALAAAASEETETILNVYEPYLMQLGFIERTPRGRVATKLAYQHLGMKYKRGQEMLL